jgi:nickel-dependent lactate racemase
VKETAMQPVERPFEVVVTTNSGFPLDLNLYQAVKGMSAASQIVAGGARSSRRPSAQTACLSSAITRTS